MDDQRDGYTGFPSPAEEYRLPSLNIQSLLVPRERTTFFVRFEGDAMVEANIFDQDLLVVERMTAYSSG
jgi:DNA polymerase V